MNLAVERFVTVGETIADDNPDIKQDMYEACKEARAAGESLNALINCNYGGLPIKMGKLFNFTKTILLLIKGVF